MTDIDTLAGPALSAAVAEAMGWELIHRAGFDWWHDSEGKYLSLGPVGYEHAWRPDVNANQALEVLAAMPAPWYVDATGYTTSSAWFVRSSNPMYSTGTFCEAICRAYLKAVQR